VREALEETGLSITLTGLLGCYSDPARDPRGHTVSVIYTATARGEPHASDDARNVALFDADKPPPLAFDHVRVLDDFRAWRRKQLRAGHRVEA
jgi:8-oxo-dGTP diphosphatase